jgi:hypothetical protein
MTVVTPNNNTDLHSDRSTLLRSLLSSRNYIETMTYVKIIIPNFYSGGSYIVKNSVISILYIIVLLFIVQYVLLWLLYASTA